MVAIIAGAAKKALAGIASNYFRKGIENMVRRGTTYVRRKYYGKRGGGKRRARTTARRTKISAPITTQRDFAKTTSTRRRRGSDYKFRMRVRAAMQADMPQRTYQALLKGGDLVTDGTQGYKGVYLLDLNTTAQGDIWNVFKDAYGLSSVADAENKSVFLKSASLDLQFYNLSTETQVYITCYTVVARRDNDINQSIGDQFTTFFQDEAAIGTVSAAHPSMTPYDVPNFLRYWKILRAYRLLIKPGESSAVSIRKSLNRKINGRSLQDNDACVRGLTHGFFFQMRGVPLNSIYDSGLSGYNVTYSAQTTIHYRQTAGDASADTIGQSK